MTKIAILHSCIGLLTIFVLGCGDVKGKDKQEENSSAPVAAVKGLDEQGRMQIDESDRCPVCAMRPKKHEKFAAALELADGRTFYFCGNGCLIRTFRHPEIFLNEDPKAIKRAVVRDYFRGSILDAKDAIWVAGSDILGPMGKALVPLKNAEDVATFRNRHGGKHVFKIDELTDEKWLAITGKPAQQQKKHQAHDH